MELLGRLRGLYRCKQSSSHRSSHPAVLFSEPIKRSERSGIAEHARDLPPLGAIPGITISARCRAL